MKKIKQLDALNVLHIILKSNLYWKRRCELAEKFIKSSPCDPDIKEDQLEAYNKWQKQKNKKVPALDLS